MLKLPHMALLTCLVCANSTYAAAVYDETTSGDLSDDNLNPTTVSFSAGQNTVKGSMGKTNGLLDRDFFSFTLQSGQNLTRLVLDQYDSSEDVSFLAIEKGAQITNLTNPAAKTSLLGSALVGTGVGRGLGDDVLDDLGTATLAGQSFTGALEAGVYSVWFQETVTNVHYTLNFQVSQVPMPPSAWTFMLGLCSIFLRTIILRKK
jgi:hypothetical protein